MDVVRAIRFPLDDDDWLPKILIGALVGWLPFVGLGYQARVARNVMRRRANPLPGPDELGEIIADGVGAFIAAVVYFVPAAMLACVVFFPIAVIGGRAATCLLWLCLVPLALVYVLPAMALYTMGMIRFAQTGNFVEFVQFRALWADVRANLGTLATLFAYLIGVGLLAGAASSVLWITCIGLPVLAFWQTVTNGHLIGQAGAEITFNE